MDTRLRRVLMVVGCLLALAAGAQAQTLRIGLAEDPDVLDPTLARSFVGRIVFSALCDKLFDIDEKLDIVPQLAASYQWSADSKALTIKLRPDVTFHDGEKLDAAAVKYSLERHKTMPGSNRRGELAPLASVDVVDPLTVRLNLSAPFSPLLAQLADRAGMIVSPKAAQAEGDKFGAKPVCAGPFRFVERVAQDRIVLERFPNYWNKAAVHFDRIVYLPIPDSTVRLANLRSGQLDFIERLAPSDVPQVKGDARFRLTKITEIGYQGITINVGKSDLAQKNPLGRDPRVREAFELALDRDGIVQVAMDGEADAGNQWVAADEHVLREERSDARAQRRAREGAAQGSRRAESVVHADDADDRRRAAHRAGRAGDGARSRLRRQDPVDRVRDVARSRRQGPVRRLRARVERTRGSRRQHLQLRRVQATAQLRRVLQAGRRRPAQAVAHDARHERAHASSTPNSRRSC